MPSRRASAGWPRGDVEIAPRRRLRLPEGALADMAASDRRARARRREALRGDAERRDLRRLPLRRGDVGARRGDRGRPARAAPDRARRAASRRGTSRGAARRTLGVIGCGHQAETQVACIRAARPVDRARRRVLPDAREARGVLRAHGRRGGREPSRRRGAGRRRHDHELARSRAPRRVARSGRARRRGRRERRRRGASSTTRVLERARFVCCDSLEQAQARVGRPRRAGAGRRARLARGARAPRGRRRARSPGVSRTTTSSSSSRTGSPPGTSRSAPRPCGSRASAASERDALAGQATEAFAASIVSPENASMISGRSSRRRCCSGVRRFWTYLSSRISVSERPRSCSRMTYRATCSSADPRENRNENMFLNPDTRRDCIPVR